MVDNGPIKQETAKFLRKRKNFYWRTILNFKSFVWNFARFDGFSHWISPNRARLADPEPNRWSWRIDTIHTPLRVNRNFECRDSAYICLWLKRVHFTSSSRSILQDKISLKIGLKIRWNTNFSKIRDMQNRSRNCCWDCFWNGSGRRTCNFPSISPSCFRKMMSAHLGERQLIAWFRSHCEFLPLCLENSASTTVATLSLKSALQKNN